MRATKAVGSHYVCVGCDRDEGIGTETVRQGELIERSGWRTYDDDEWLVGKDELGQRDISDWLEAQDLGYDESDLYEHIYYLCGSITEHDSDDYEEDEIRHVEPWRCGVCGKLHEEKQAAGKCCDDEEDD